MVWYFYGTVLAASFFNWGGIATEYNIKNNKGDLKFLQTLNYNDKILKEHFKTDDQNIYYDEPYFRETFLSKILYYESLKK